MERYRSSSELIGRIQGTLLGMAMVGVDGELRMEAIHDAIRHCEDLARREIERIPAASAEGDRG